MKNKPFVGVWMDHREAFLFWADSQADIRIQHVKSEYQETAEPVDRAGGGPRGVQGPVFVHASVERRRKEQLNHYYKQIVHILHTASEIYVFGPGLAKRELARTVQGHDDLADCLKAVENADHMTQPQMAARVREFFQLPREA